MDQQELAEKCLTALREKDGFSKWLGVEVLQISPGKAVIKMKIRKEMLNGFGICHGGVTFSFADSAFAFASNSHGKIAYSMESSIFYNEKILEGDEIIAEAEEISSNNKTALYNVIVRKNNSPAVVFKGIVYRTGKNLADNE